MSGLEEKAKQELLRRKQDTEDDDESQDEASSVDSDSEEENDQRRQEKIITAMLKQRCALRPKLPVLDLKSYRNTVPVPKVDAEAAERVIEKPPYKLPSYIAATGIEKVREACIEKEDGDKLGTLDIDYQVLYNAFFKNQTKPKLTAFGEVYYEGKEFDPMSLREEMKKCGIREAVDERKLWGDLEEEEEDEEDSDDMAAENEKKRKRKMKWKVLKVGKYKNKKKDIMF